MDDAALLGEFIRTQSETAFRTLVERHTGMVYRVCRRALGGNPSEAEDATQATFIVLARKAAGISTAVELPAWLHRVALLAARQARRTLARRRERETRAAAEEATMRHAASHPDDAAATARQHLDDAVGSLSAKLRPAIILHYFEGKTVAETAQALGCAEEAAKKRIAHGLERLRLSLARRGVALPATALSSLLEADATKAAPAALSEAAATVAFASLSGGAWVTSGAGLLAKGALKTLFWAKVKTAAAAVAVTGIVAGGGLAATLALVHRPPAPVAAVRPPATPAAPVTAGMVLIPGGTNAGTEPYTGKPCSLTVESFLMDRCEVTKALWYEVEEWGRGHGYRLGRPNNPASPHGLFGDKAPNHPVHSVSWYECVIWCNARSEQDGFMPVYYDNAACTAVVRGESNHRPFVKATADGYRLPTLVEWQYAARGGQPAHRFPWHDAETIDHSRANYYSLDKRPWDTSPTRGYHPTYAVEPQPYTSPVGAFAPNAYGLYDMIGNVWEWCADEVYPGGDGWLRTFTGGSWKMSSERLGWPLKYNYMFISNDLGFRTVRTPAAASAPKPSSRP